MRTLEPATALFNFLASRKYDEPLAWGKAIETRERPGATPCSWGRPRWLR